MWQSPGDDDKEFCIFLLFNEFTKDFITNVKEKDKMDYDEYLTALEEKLKGSHIVWSGSFRGVSQHLAESVDSIASEAHQRTQDCLNIKSGHSWNTQQVLNKSDFYDGNFESDSLEDPQQASQITQFFTSLNSGNPLNSQQVLNKSDFVDGNGKPESLEDPEQVLNILYFYDENVESESLEDPQQANPRTEFFTSLNSGNSLNSQQDYNKSDVFVVIFKSGLVEHQEQFTKEKIQEMNFGETRRFPLLPDCNASQINLKLKVMDGKYPVCVEDSICVNLLDFKTKPRGQKSAVENPSDDP